MDGIYSRVFKELHKELAEQLSIIFQASWRIGGIPDDWKRMNVVLVSKKGKKDDLGNYRALSVRYGKS